MYTTSHGIWSSACPFCFLPKLYFASEGCRLDRARSSREESHEKRRVHLYRRSVRLARTVWILSNTLKWKVSSDRCTYNHRFAKKAYFGERLANQKLDRSHIIWTNKVRSPKRPTVGKICIFLKVVDLNLAWNTLKVWI